MADTLTTPAGARARLLEIREIEKSQGPAPAERALVGYLREQPQSHQGFLALARLLMKQRKFDDAARAAAKAKALAPLESDPVVVLGLANLRREDTAGAAEAFAEALKIEPSSARAHLGAAAVKMAEEDYDDAIALCERVLDLDPSLERAHELMARINMKRGRTDLALEELRGLVESNPENRRVLKAYIKLMRRENRSDEAISVLEADAAAHPGDRRRATRLSQVAASAGNVEHAQRQYEEAQSEGRANTAAKLRYVTALIRGGELDRARAVIDDLGPQKVLRPIAAKLSGDVALKAGDAQAAVAQYKQACKLARADGLSDAVAAEAEAEGPEKLARAWRDHTQTTLAAAVRARRSAADAG